MSTPTPGAACACRCHANPIAGCHLDAGHGLGCGPHTVTDENGKILAEQIPPGEACIADRRHRDPVRRQIGLLCRGCYHWISRTLTEILELYALLDDAILPGAGGSDGIPHGKRTHSPAPGRVDVMALTDPRSGTDGPLPDVPGVLYRWARLFAPDEFRARRFAVSGDGVASRQRITRDVASLTRVLHKHRHRIAQLPDVDEYARELRGVHQALGRVTGARMWPQAIGDCPNCHRPIYNDLHNANTVTCSRCHGEWSGPEYARLRLTGRDRFIQRQEAERTRA